MQVLDTVVNLIHEWQPELLPKELKYRDSLASSKETSSISPRAEARASGGLTNT